MNGDKRLRLIFDSLAIALGTLFFLLFSVLCFAQTLGSPGESNGTAIFNAFLGVCSVVGGAFLRSAGPPEAQRCSTALIVEGVLLVLLTLIARVAMGPS